MKKTTPQTKQPVKAIRGFSAMKPETQRRIASLGGKAAMSIKGHARRIGAIGGKNSHRGDPGRAP